MIHRPSNPRRNVIPYLAVLLVLVVGAGGGYALAASNDKTITVCADKNTGVLHLKTHGRCKSSQTRVTWNQEGPQGAQGPQGAAGAQGTQGAQGPVGAQGPAGVTVWADVTGTGSVFAGSGIFVQHGSKTGSYQVTITDPTCSREHNAPVITVSDSDPTNLSGSAAVAWFEATATNQQFMVFTGDVGSAGFSAGDRTFDVLDSCS
jgi:hypothetical protein